MKYINNYADLAAYTADSNRPTTASTVSNINDGTGVIFSGKNVLMPKIAANYGDIVVYDTMDNLIKIIKCDTYYAATKPANLNIIGIVYHVTNNTAHVVAKDQYTGQLWGAPYRVKLTGFDFATGGSFTVIVNATTTGVITYANTDTLATTAVLIMTALQAAGFTAATGWSVTADVVNNCVVVQQNWYTPNVTIFTVTDGDSKIIRLILTGNYQTALTGLLTPYGFIRMKCGINTSRAGCNYAKFYLYYSVSGQDLTAQAVTSDSIIKESRFNATDNPLLTAYYATYAAYIQDKMLIYPNYSGAIKDNNGQNNTRLLSGVSYTDQDGILKAAYPAARTAKSYGITVVDHITGFEVGGWWLPDVRILNLLMIRITYGLTGITGVNADAVNRSINAIGGTLLSVSHYPWSSTESASNNAWVYYGANGYMGASGKTTSSYVRPVTAFQLR